MEKLKSILSWLAGGILAVVIIINFFSGWLINPPQPKAFEENGTIWIEEPSSPFLYYLFGFATLHEGRKNNVTGQYEFLKNGDWIPVSSKK